VDQVAECLAAPAMSNCIIMGNSVSPKDMDNLDATITTYRLKLLTLLQLHLTDNKS
jgi:hypothetical protein